MAVQGEVLGRSIERRRHARGDLPLTAVLFQRDATLGRFVVQNLSASGALLTGRRDVSTDERVRVLLALPGRDPLVLAGRVARRASAPNQLYALAVQFKHSTPGTEDEIQEALVAEIQRRAVADRPAVLLVQESSDLCQRLRADLEWLGRRVLVATTPLDAVTLIENPDARVEQAFVDVSVGDLDGLELMQYIADEHPSVRRILVQGAVRPSVVELMQAARFVHGVIADPWDVETLREAVGKD